jgi:hypothetical protein
MVISPSASHSFSVDMTGDHVVVVSELLVANHALIVLFDNSSLQKFSHLGWGDRALGAELTAPKGAPRLVTSKSVRTRRLRRGLSMRITASITAYSAMSSPSSSVTRLVSWFNEFLLRWKLHAPGQVPLPAQRRPDCPLFWQWEGKPSGGDFVQQFPGFYDEHGRCVGLRENGGCPCRERLSLDDRAGVGRINDYGHSGHELP